MKFNESLKLYTSNIEMNLKKKSVKREVKSDEIFTVIFL